MKIGIVTRVSNFTDGLMEKWKAWGHEVQRQIHYDAEIGDWAEMLFFDFVGEDLARASRSDTKAALIGRLQRIEYHRGNLNRPKFNWERVTAIVFVGEYYRQLSLARYPILHEVKTVHIPNGIDLDKFTFREHDGSSKKIAWVSKGFFFKKGPERAMRLAMLLPQGFELHMTGRGGDLPCVELMNYWRAHFPQLQAVVKEVGWISDINSFLEDKDFVLNSSEMESQCVAVGEAMAKGLKPLVFHWAGASLVWPDWALFLSDAEFLARLNEPFESTKYRNYVEEHFDLNKIGGQILDLV